MKIYQIIVLTKSNFTSKYNFFQIKEPVSLISTNSIKHKDSEIFFDYLLFDDPLLIINFKNTNILHEMNIPVTNFNFETSIENIFYDSDLNKVINLINEENI